MALDTARDRLSKRATIYKKAWIFSCAWIGEFPGHSDVEVPDYRSWSKSKLSNHLKDLEADFAGHARLILSKPDQKVIHLFALWMATECDRWATEGAGLLVVSNAMEFEAQFGSLRARTKIEVPPYAELLVQAWHGVAIRHPEYMLARDLEFLFLIYNQAEAALKRVNWAKPPAWTRAASEHGQGLARAVIQSCFNLLESFVSGLARAHVMTHKSLESQTNKRLLDNARPLRSRMLNIPLWIVGHDCGLRQHEPPFSLIFGIVKQRRDAFVHCEPGTQLSSHGYVKETAFHNVSPAIVNEAVDGTYQIIRQVWKCVSGTEGPRWLTDHHEDAKLGFKLQPSTTALPLIGA